MQEQLDEAAVARTPWTIAYVTVWSGHTVLLHQQNNTFTDTVHMHLLTCLLYAFPDMSDSEPSGNFGYKS